MAYENNHYIPQLVLRRFGNKINKYNIKTKEYMPNGSIKSSFSEKNLYPKELEILLSTIEGKFADLLNNKILKAEKELVLLRKDINLIKKFLALEMLRVPDALIERPELKDNDEYFEKKYNFKEKKIENETYKDYVFRSMKVLIESETTEDIPNHKDATYLAMKWSRLYQNCYITIWDSKQSGEDFVISDRGMTCEHEKTRFMFTKFGINEELIKKGFLLSKINDNNVSIEAKHMYALEMLRCSQVYANYYIFTISETRTIGLINPWFRLHYDENKINIAKGTPDTFPCMLSKEAMEPNTNKYINNIENMYFKPSFSFDENDEYIYKIKDLDFKDVSIINCLVLDRADELIGFVNTSKIIKSLNIYTNLKLHLNDYTVLKNILSNFGYDFPNTEKIKKIAFDFTYINYNEIDKKYIDLMFYFIKNQKDVKM